jgi:hypothetical protein
MNGGLNTCFSKSCGMLLLIRRENSFMSNQGLGFGFH